ncbi:MAG: DNA mismatch repair endonuclease MutL [Clostridiales bacterium]|jgi:DNA mismatch repair protein MutL|nr:DNA mismatch repair endonuclease MutL [Clostridiales bacterium]
MQSADKRINLLPPEVYNRIAAGEVVDRPCSIVKELVENCIDAGAKNICIEILNGGIQSIKVIDDGCGIVADDLPLAFLAHATSKIMHNDDLNHILSLGFRGEALSSIASVSNVKVVSRTQNQNLASFLDIVDGKILQKGECGAPYGTAITVSNLFENVPARKNFLKKSSTEQAHITSVVEKLILSKPNIRFKYISENKVVYQSNGTGLKDAIYIVFGKDFVDNIVKVEQVVDEFKLSGYVGRVGFSKPNSLGQVLIVNGRVVTDSAISKVVYNCFCSYLMTRQYPVFVLVIEIEPNLVDVNVHPNKLEIKFVNKDRVCSVVGRACKTSMDLITPQYQQSETLYTRTSLKSELPSVKSQQPSLLHKAFSMYKPNSISEGGTLGSILTSQYNADSEQGLPYPSLQERKLQDKTVTVDKSELLQSKRIEQTEKNLQSEHWLDALLVGSLFDTYIVLQDADKVYFIDQHAAHEKLLYDKLCEQTEKSQVAMQTLLVPYIFDLATLDKELLLENLQDINQVGFDIRDLGMREMGIFAVPTICSDMDLHQFVSLILNYMRDKRKLNKTDFLIQKLQQAACKAAIKGKQHLTQGEIHLLLKAFKQSGSALFCPHGRPVVFVITKNEIEKWFKRIV